MVWRAERTSHIEERASVTFNLPSSRSTVNPVCEGRLSALCALESKSDWPEAGTRATMPPPQPKPSRTSIVLEFLLACSTQMRPRVGPTDKGTFGTPHATHCGRIMPMVPRRDMHLALDHVRLTFIHL